ncbi:hypothetical protein [Burkholderia phage BCSR5]|nr:hypothetical protein [Burkholderia phage BCSR5]
MNFVWHFLGLVVMLHFVGFATGLYDVLILKAQVSDRGAFRRAIAINLAIVALAWAIAYLETQPNV